MIKKIAYILITIITLASCESVIEPDLKDIESQLVIEGVITNEAGPYYVKLSKSTNFTTSSIFNGVENAQVIITDDSGIIDTLTMSEPGIYITSKITGTPNVNYTLKVIAEEKEYNSQCTMPSFTKLDTLLIFKQSLGATTIRFVNTFYTDPAGVENYYRYKTAENNKVKQGVSITNDQFSDGIIAQNTVSVYPEIPGESHLGDTINVAFLCIDKSEYDYFFGLAQASGGNGAVPANPKSNISGGCLGYFCAHTIDKRSIILE